MTSIEKEGFETKSAQKQARVSASPLQFLKKEKVVEGGTISEERCPAIPQKSYVLGAVGAIGTACFISKNRFNEYH